MEKLVVGDFLSWRSFAEYAERHYLGLLDELSENESFSADQRDTLCLLHDDLVSIINKAEEFDRKMGIKGNKKE